jgi:DNA-binding MarR family transcriptional regulator
VDIVDNSNSPFAIDNLEKDPGFLMLQVSRLWAETHDRKLKKHFGLSDMQYAVLASIYWFVLHDRQVTQTTLARHTKIDPMTISQMFKVLEKKGYIHRTIHVTDIRAKTVHLTQQGLELMRQTVPVINDVDAKFFQILGKDLPRFNKYMVDLLKSND